MELIQTYFEGLTQTQTEQFAALGPLYRDWNSRINLISRKDLDHLYEKHVLHSLSIAAVAGFAAGNRVLDIGTGGGFPGIPLAIFYPETEFVLADSVTKKIRAVESIVSSLGLKNVKTLNGRVEEFKDLKFDFTVSRAVASLADLWSWSRKLLKKGHSAGIANGLICLKGGDLEAEIAESGCRARIYNLYRIFPRSYFLEKALIQVSF